MFKADPPLPLPDLPSIAVLPFTEASGDFDAQAFADGLTDGVTYALARIGALFVSGRNSAFTFKGRKASPQEIGRALGVAHVLDGTLEGVPAHGEDRFAVEARLSETAGGRLVWAHRFEEEADAIPAFQARLAERILTAIAPGTTFAPETLARSRVSPELGVYRKFLATSTNTPATSEDVLRVLLGSLASIAGHVPGEPLPVVLMAQCHANLVAQGWSRDVAADAAEGVRLARLALDHAGGLASDDPAVLMMVGHTLGFLGQQFETAIALIERALALNPNSASAYERSGWVRCFSGEPEIAAAHFRMAKRLSPLDHSGFRFDAGLGLALCMTGRHEDALPALRRAIADTPTWTSSHRALAASLALLGREAEAHAIAREALAREPGFRIGLALRVFRPSAGRDLYAEGLRLAGLPE